MHRRSALATVLSMLAAATHADLPAVPADAIETATGLRYQVIKPAAGSMRLAEPGFIEFAIDDLSDGVGAPKRQLSSVRKLAQSSPGLARAVLITPIGETRRWWMDGPAAPGGPQVLDVTVIGNSEPVKTPADLARPPAAAVATASGLAYVVLQKGRGQGHPSPTSTIEIHYSGWTSDGKLFDSSVVREERAFLPLPDLIPGWQEGLQLMSPGDTFRFWVPGHLAYDSSPRPDAPRGMLVFDVTLYSFTNGSP